MDWLKKHKKIFFIIFFIIIILVGLGLLVKVLIFPSVGKDNYGNRLDGIGQVKINQDSITKMKQDISDNESVESIDTDLKGRIVNVIIEVKSGTKILDAKKIADKTLEYFTGDQKEYYDIQVFLMSDDENYSYIGYKHKTSKGFMWTNN